MITDSWTGREIEHDENDGCYRCDSTGVIVTCIDDYCRALGSCIHGDGEEPCPDCDGDW